MAKSRRKKQQELARSRRSWKKRIEARKARGIELVSEPSNNEKRKRRELALLSQSFLTLAGSEVEAASRRFPDQEVKRG